MSVTATLCMSSCLAEFLKPGKSLQPARASRHVDLTVAIAWALENPAPKVDALVAQLGRDHRRLGFPPEVYDTFAQCLIDGLGLFELSPELAGTAATRLRSICTIMKDEATKADWEGIPAGAYGDGGSGGTAQPQDRRGAPGVRIPHGF